MRIDRPCDRIPGVTSNPHSPIILLYVNRASLIFPLLINSLALCSSEDADSSPFPEAEGAEGSEEEAVEEDSFEDDDLLDKMG